MDLKINKNNNKDKKFKKGKVYIIYYYPPDILITEDPELKKLFRGSKDMWTIIDEKGEEYLVDAILLFYGLPIKKKEFEKLKTLDDKELEYYYQISLIYLFSTLTHYRQGFVKKIVDKLTLKKAKGKPIKVKDILEDIEINQGDAIQRAFNYYQKVQELGSIYVEVTKSKRWGFGSRETLSSISKANTRTIINIGVVIIIIIILISMFIFLLRANNMLTNSMNLMSNTTKIGGQIYNITNPIS
jgi:hypothetical protein